MPKVRSKPELLLYEQIVQAGLEAPVREYRFHAKRRFRFDLAWPLRKIAVEVDGGVFTQGRHTRGVGFIADCEKMNLATLDGWRVLRVPAQWVEKSNKALELVKEALDS